MMQLEQPDVWISGAQAALLLGVSASRVRQLRLSESLPGMLTASGWRYQRGDVNRLTVERSQQASLVL